MDAISFYSSGINKVTLGKYAEAIIDFNEAIKLKPNYAEAYHDRGYAQHRLGQAKDALADYDHAIKLNPIFAQTYSNRGEIKARLGKYDEAKTDYDQAINLNPNYAEPFNNRGVLNLHLRNYETAILDFDKAIELNPAFAMAYNGKGNVRVELGKYDEALSDYTKAVELEPDNSIFLQNKHFVQQILEKAKDTKIQEEKDRIIREELETNYRFKIDKLEAENAKLVAEKDIESVRDITHYFDYELKYYKKQSKFFLYSLISILLVMLFGPIVLLSIIYWNVLDTIHQILSLSFSDHLNGYLYTLPLIAIEILFYLIYKKADRLMHFYRHRIAVIGSLKGEESHNDKIYADNYNAFKLQQYAKLYEPPTFIGETSVAVKSDGISFKNSEKK